MNTASDCEVQLGLGTLALSCFQLPKGNGGFDSGRDLPGTSKARVSLPPPPPSQENARRGQPYRGDKGRRGPLRQSPRPTAPSAAGKWGCVRGRGGRCHGSWHEGAHLRGKKKAARSKEPGDASTPTSPRHLPAAGCPRPWKARRRRRAPRSSVAMAAGTVGRPREDGKGKANAPDFPDDGAPEKSKGLDSYGAE